MSDLRIYWPGIDEFGSDGYPVAWHTIKHEVRAAAGHRCVRCGHPYQKGAGEWSPCDERCSHGDPARDEQHPFERLGHGTTTGALIREAAARGVTRIIEARWRILTVHHLTGDKADCRWWNLAALCQRCHLEIQGKVVMDRTWPHEHSEWFRPYVAGYYAWRYRRENVTRDEAERRIDELLALEVRQLGLEIA